MFKASNTVRVFFLNVATMVLIGIGLTGFDVVHWFAYVLPGFLIVAAILGICPGLIISGKILKLIGVKE